MRNEIKLKHEAADDYIHFLFRYAQKEIDSIQLVLTARYKQAEPITIIENYIESKGNGTVREEEVIPSEGARELETSSPDSRYNWKSRP